MHRMPDTKNTAFAPTAGLIRMQKQAADAVAPSTPAPGPTTSSSGGGGGDGGGGNTPPSSGTPTPVPTPGDDSPSSDAMTPGTPLYSPAYYSPVKTYGGDEWYQHYWFWALVALVFLGCTLLILGCVLKSCMCQHKKSMKYQAPTKTYGTNTPVTDKHRAEMEAKYGKFGAY
mmetsp:Transcript_746/g.2687  ORF Transcript_746/g.2687 Transcript_746/m.2687 type:complete len:172 (-) Transcript_746:64-579(-)